MIPQAIMAAYDTETTGLPNKKLPMTHKEQPHIVQLATVLYKSDGTELGTFDMIIKPDGYTEMPIKAFEAHGITFERAMDEGVDRKIVLDAWKDFVRPAKLMVAHNNWFDKQLLDINMRRTYNDIKQSYRYKKYFCTMQTYMPICKLPATEKMLRYGFGPYKNPTLTEVHEFLFGEGFEGAHNALEDVRAVGKVFFKLPLSVRESAFSGKDK